MSTIIHAIILPNGTFPNNPKLPFLIYKQCIDKNVEEVFLKNGWKNLWVNGIYPFHHYHSNAHEVLGVSEGWCKIEVGGNGGSFFEIEKGDAVIIPVGVSHKNIGCSDDFECIGAYPTDTEYNMQYGKENELEKALEEIEKVKLPKTDPVFGKDGPLFSFWQELSGFSNR